jgi:hypothetical protein
MTKRTRNLRRGAILAVATTVTVFGAVPAQAHHKAAEGGSEWANHPYFKHVQTECRLQDSRNGDNDLVSARTTYDWGAYGHKKNNLYRFKLRARLIPTTPGLSFHRNWESRDTYIADSLTDATFRSTWSITTEPQSSQKDWDLQVKGKWYRRGKLAWRRTKVRNFDESGFCREI